MKKQLNSIGMLLLFAAITLTAGAAAGQENSGKQFKVKYDSGTESLTKGMKVTVNVGANAISVQPEKGTAFNISVPGITEVSYDTIEKKRTKQGAALMVASPLAGLILMGTKSARHYVTIVSKEGGQDKDVSFEIGKDDRDAFLAEMQRVTGHPWRDRVAERKKTETELDHLKNEKIPVQIDRKAGVNGVELKPGLYQIVLLERADNRGELYFFAGKDVKPQKSMAHAPVDISPQSGKVTTAEVKYDDLKGVAVITEIQTSAKVLRLRSE